MRYLAPIIVFTLLGCGKDPTIVLSTTVDESLALYLEMFEVEMNVDTSYVSAVFEPQEKPTMAVCYSWSYGDREIRVDKDVWDRIEPSGRVQLMYHELGHCAMGLDHDDRMVDTERGEVYGSIMNKYWFGAAWFWEVYKSNYKEALKSDTLMIP